VTTRQAIEAITDSGKFEQLCAAIIRKLRPEVSSLIEIGTNKAGQSVKGPIDGFTKTAINGKPYFFSTQHTISKNLEKKWLDEKTGDVVKTSKHIYSLRETYPNAEFELMLTTTLVPDLELHKAVLTKGEEVGLRISFLDQSGIAGFLDSDPHGQWLRYAFLGINYQLISKDIIPDLSRRDLQNYQSKFFLPKLETVTAREINIEPPLQKVVFVVGNSGTGKSTALSTLWNDHLSNEEPVFWLDAELLIQTPLFDTCLREKLTSLKSDLYLNTSTWYTNEYWDLTLFVVDDINKVTDKSQVVHRIKLWQKELNDNNWNVTFCIPMWEDTFFQFDKKDDLLHSIFLKKYSVLESRRALTTIPVLSNKDNFLLDRIAEDLANDPFLIGLYKSMLTNSTDVLQSTQDTIKEFIENSLIKLAEISPHLHFTDYLSALKRLGFEMLKNKNLNPYFDQTLEWISASDTQVQCIRDIIKDGKLANIDNNRNLNFRHDRIRDYLLADSLAEHSSEFESDWRFKEIHYSYLIGKALTQLDDTRSRFFFNGF
jgi:energy-coupling factor transporter ATP-binding protein EcfA2